MTKYERIKKKFEEVKRDMSDGAGSGAVFDTKTGGAVFRSKDSDQLMIATIKYDEKNDVDVLKDAGVLVENLPDEKLDHILAGLGKEGKDQPDQNPFLPIVEDKESDQTDSVNPFLIPIDMIDSDSD